MGRPPVSKRLMRAIWLRLPRTAATYDLAKMLTRSVLRPEATPLLADVCFSPRFRLRVDLSDIVGNDLYCMGDHYEAPTLALWCSLARGAETIVDLGSHVGLFACAAAAVNARARILAVEAFGPNARLLRANAAPFGNLRPLEAAIGSSTGRRTFRVSPITGGGYVEDEAAATLATPGTRDRTAETFPLDTVALAELCEQEALGRIDLLKIDLEGLEQPLLTGQETFWGRWAPRHVIAELTLHRGEAGARRPLFEAMARRGYRHRRLEGLHAIPWFQQEDLANWHFWKDS